MKQSYDVVVIGGGHAGCEAAHAAGRYGARVALITHRFDRIGEMSCNPAMGGLGKSHLMREVDALDGLIAKCADKAGIQFRVLNRSRGPAVRGPRAQCDRDRYRTAMQYEISSAKNITVLEDEVTELLIKQGQIQGVRAVNHEQILCGAVVITTGTFLRGAMHIGGTVHEGGRWHDPASITLSDQVRALGFRVGRLKTGTPARLNGESIHWAELSEQKGDSVPEAFSYLSQLGSIDQVSCYVTRTTEEAHKIIRKNLTKSAMYGGQIQGVGPRYCPSIEDKVVRFAEKTSHNVFLEPETKSGNIIYPNGISSSLPAKVQEEFIRTMPGLSQAHIVQPGYAIEYDYIDPIEVHHSLETKRIRGLYLAGQLIGTTGYEEAAALGLVAGVNSARKSSNIDPIFISRSQGYIGVMIDDLTTRGVSEPYRMFTSRAEFRLSLRVDNADERLTRLGIDAGIVKALRSAHFSKSAENLDELRQRLDDLVISPHQAESLSIQINQDGVCRTYSELLSYPEVNFEVLCKLEPSLEHTPPTLRARVEADAVYRGLLQRQYREIRVLEDDEKHVLCHNIDYMSISSLSAEAREKLARIKPRDLSQARRIEGITAAAITTLLPYTSSASISKVA